MYMYIHISHSASFKTCSMCLGSPKVCSVLSLKGATLCMSHPYTYIHYNQARASRAQCLMELY